MGLPLALSKRPIPHFDPILDNLLASSAVAMMAAAAPEFGGGDFVESPTLHNRALALQEFLLLHEEHEELTQHLRQIRPLRTRTTSRNTSPLSTPAVSPILSAYGAPSPPPRRHHRSSHHHNMPPPPPPPRCINSSSSSLDTVWDEDTIYEVEADEQRLSNINEGMKRTLTELLNCDAVREDRSFRMWVQCRLMETEKELRSGRRRRCAM